MSRLIYLIAVVCFSLHICSCVNTKQISYLQGSLDSSKFSQVQVPDLKIQKGDMLQVTVYSDNAIASAPFNMASGSAAATPGSSSAAKSVATGLTYLVDNQGDIQFPIIGILHVDGLTKFELAKLLSSKLETTYVNMGYYNIQFLNNKITLLGELNRPGPYSIPNERVNLLEAIGMAGDLTFFGRRDNVLVIREIGGKREFGRIDLRDPNLFLSPYFQLQQNDVVYIDATKQKVTSNDQTTLRYISIAAAVASTIAVIYSIFR